MVETNEKDPRGRPKKIDVSQDLCEQQELETILSQLPSGYIVHVHREEPEWCKGYLGRIYCDNENLNLDLIKSRFGGRVLSLRFMNAQNKFKGSKRVIFPEAPKKEGRVITETEIQTGQIESRDSPHHQIGQGGYIPPGMPPHLAQQLAAYYAGVPIPAPAATPQQNPLDVMQSQQIMSMMNAQMTAQQELMRSNMAHYKEMEEIRRESERERERHRKALYEGHEPMTELNKAITLIRELNGIKTELGTADTTSTIIGHAAPIVENAVAEFIELFKLRTQAEIAKARMNIPPELPPRRSEPVVIRTKQNTSAGDTNGHEDPVELARKLKKYYDSLPPGTQNEIMSALLSPSDEILDSEAEESQNDDIGVEYVLTDEDRQLLENENRDEQDTGEEISSGEHSGSAQDDN